MKSIIIILLILGPLSFNSNGQINLTSKNIIHYKADYLKQLSVKNYQSLKKVDEKVLSEKVLGVNVDIYVDTVFKKYTILDKDENDTTSGMTFSYVRNYFSEKKFKRL